MLGQAALMAFVATANAEKARAFYGDQLGLTLIEDGPFGLVFDCGGTVLRIQKVETVAAIPYTALGWRVSDVPATVRGLVERGVLFERFPGIDQDEDGIWTTPDGTGVAWFKDPDGNLLSVSTDS